MKGLIFDIKRFAIHDGPGIRTTIFLKGCPLECWWCHNPESRKPEQETIVRKQKLNEQIFEVEEVVGKWKTVNEVMEQIAKERIFMDESGGGVTLSGGEPLVQLDFSIALLKACKDSGIHTALDTSGYASEKSVKEILNYVDLFLFDIKLIKDSAHKEFTGKSNRRILENLKFIHDSRKELIIRYPVIPGINDTQDHAQELLSYIKNELKNVSQLDVLPYHKIAGHKYKSFGIQDRMTDVQEPLSENIHKLKKLFENSGLNVNIGG